MKKIIGLSCGKKNGNCETFLTEALMAAEEMGVETELIRAMSLKVLPCRGCGGCNETGKCVLKDDVDWIVTKTMDTDAGLIISVPCYHIRANGYFTIISERTNHIFDHKMDILKRNKVAGMIGVGGSGYDAWASLTNPMVNIFIQHGRVLVDKIQVNFCGMNEWNLWARKDMTPVTHKARVQDLDYEDIWKVYPQDYNAADFYKKALARSRELGRNIANAMNRPIEEVKYVGEESGVSCPACHSNVLLVHEELPYVGCPICWVRGVVKMENGKMKVEWNKDDAKNPRFSYEGVTHHREWLQQHHMGPGAPENREKIMEMTEKNRKYDKIIKPEK